MMRQRTPAFGAASGSIFFYRTSFAYDAAGRRTRLVDANNRRVTFLFDALARDIGSIDPLGRRVTLGYDAASNRLFKVDPRGNRVTSVYDASNRLTAERFSTGRRHTYVYDRAGKRTRSADPTGVYTTSYDALNRVGRAINPLAKIVTYAYDGAGRRTRLIDPDAGRFTYSYDLADRLTVVRNPQGKRTSFTYDPLARQTQQIHGNAALTTQVFDSAGQLTCLINASSGGLTVNRFTYTYDKAGNRILVQEAYGDRTTWTYDKTYQLLHEKRGGVSAFDVTHTYDPAGNRTSQTDSGTRTTYAYDVANQLLTETTGTARTTYLYDNCGNRTQKNAPGNFLTYEWDELNRLSQANPLTTPVTLAYDAAGHRVKKTVGAQVRQFIYDFEKLLQEADGTNATTKEYTSTEEQYGNLLSAYANSSGATTYHEFDGLGSTDALVNDMQAATDRYRYRAYGLMSHTQGNGSTDFDFVGKQGYFDDPEVNLYFLRARYYDVLVARFLSEDPRGYAPGPNLYSYAHNNPVNATDPSGLQPNLGNLLGAGAGLGLSLPSVPPLPSFPSLPTLPSLPSFPSLPSLPSLPSFPPLLPPVSFPFPWPPPSAIPPWTVGGPLGLLPIPGWGQSIFSGLLDQAVGLAKPYLTKLAALVETEFTSEIAANTGSPNLFNPVGLVSTALRVVGQLGVPNVSAAIQPLSTIKFSDTLLLQPYQLAPAVSKLIAAMQRLGLTQDIREQVLKLIEDNPLQIFEKLKGLAGGIGTSSLAPWLTGSQYFPNLPGNLFGLGVRQPLGAGSCFVAGTLVKTESELVPIERLRPLDARVFTVSPGETPQQPALRDSIGDINECRLVTLHLERGDTDSVTALLVRSREWLEATRAQEGGRIRVEIPEMDMCGWAVVRAIEPCPPIKPGKGRLVTGVFKHSRGVVYDLRVDGEQKPICGTGTHPFWSVDRQAWVALMDLRPGERLQGRQSMLAVRSVTRRSENEAVFNIEVDGDHVYRVGEWGVLVHNQSLGLVVLGVVVVSTAPAWVPVVAVIAFWLLLIGLIAMIIWLIVEVVIWIVAYINSINLAQAAAAAAAAAEAKAFPRAFEQLQRVLLKVGIAIALDTLEVHCPTRRHYNSLLLDPAGLDRATGAFAILDASSIRPAGERDDFTTYPMWWMPPNRNPMSLPQGINWDRGHLLGSKLGGDGGMTLENLVAQTASANEQDQWLNVERIILEAAQAGDCIVFVALPCYGQRNYYPNFVKFLAVAIPPEGSGRAKRVIVDTEIYNDDVQGVRGAPCSFWIEDVLEILHIA
jgi:RHS repeat-associated protein